MPLGMGEKITWHTTGTQTTQTKKGGHRDHRSKCLPSLTYPGARQGLEPRTY